MKSVPENGSGSGATRGFWESQFVVVSPGRWDRAAWDLRAGRRGPGTADWSPVSREFSAAWGRGAELPGLRSLRSGREQRTLRAGAWRGQAPRVLQRLRGPGEPTAQRKRRDKEKGVSRKLVERAGRAQLSSRAVCVRSLPAGRPGSREGPQSATARRAICSHVGLETPASTGSSCSFGGFADG